MALRATRSLITFFTVLLLLQQISAQTAGGRWLTPDSSQGAFSTSFAAGNTIKVAWKAFNNSRSDLWLTHSDTSGFPWHAKVGSNIDISVDGAFSWHIDVPTSTINNDNRFMLHFFPLNAPYSTAQVVQYSSPGFLINGGAPSSAVTGAVGVASASQSAQATSSPGPSVTSESVINSVSPTVVNNQSLTDLGSTTGSSNTSFLTTTTNAAGNTITATITTSVPLSTSDSSTQNNTSSSVLSNIPLGAQAGIGVAAGFLIILLFCAGCFFGRRVGLNRTHRKNQIEDSDSIKMQPRPQFGLFGDECATVVRVARPPTSYTTVSELDDTSLLSKPVERYQQSRGPLVELAGSTTFPVEKASVMIRPGVYEVH